MLQAADGGDLAQDALLRRRSLVHADLLDRVLAAV